MLRRQSLTFFWVALILSLQACTSAPPTPTVTPTQEPMTAMDNGGMDDMGVEPSPSTQQFAPLVRGFHDGGEVLFIHTEASDPDVAGMLTEMMGGPLVVLAPVLAGAPPSLLANVYVFTNGVEGHGPFGYQPDIFDAVPGDEGYRPLRSVHLVTWQDDATARELRSVAELQAAEAEGQLTIEQPGIVVNMPILAWPGGSR